MRKLLFVTLMIAFAHVTFAYDEKVHGVITSHAAAHLTADLHAHLGVSLNTAIAGSTPALLLRSGAIQEDQIPRPLNHFYDPIHDRPLTLGKAPLCFTAPSASRAPDWALGETFLPNSFDLADARAEYRQALLASDPASRSEHVAKLFTNLGHVIHLLQDMAQPEHVRNDMHLVLGGWADTVLAAVIGEKLPSLYEAWGVVHLLGTAPVASYDGYPNVNLPDYESYFHTPEKSGSGQSLGRGLADFANRGFVTQDTNYGDYSKFLEQPCYRYDEPRLQDASGRLQTVTEHVLAPDGSCCIPKEVEESILTSTIVDYYTGATEVDPFHAFTSALDLETRKYDPNSVFYSLGDPSYLTRASILLPRAVGYSAGLVDHFFRGKVDADWTESAPGVYDLTIINRSDETIGADANLSAVFRATPAYFGGSGDVGTIFNGSLANAVPGFAGLAPGGSVTVHDVHPFGLKAGDALPSFERRIAITATLGDEVDAVIGRVQPAEKGLEIRIDWAPGHDDAYLQFFVVDKTLDTTVGKHDSSKWLWAEIVTSGDPTNCPGRTSDSIPNSSIGSNGTNSMAFTLDPVPSNESLVYVFAVYSCLTPTALLPVNVKMLRNGSVIDSKQDILDPNHRYFLTGNYPLP